MTVVLILVFLIYGTSLFTQTDKPRLLVLTDIGGDPDDIQSLRRLLVYSNEFRIEGIIATATWGRRPHRKRGVYYINEYLIDQAIDDYAQVYENLILHDNSYPLPEELRAIVKGGQKDRGVNNLIAGKITSGSSHIIATVDASVEPLWITIWGGAHDLAQALLDVRESRSEEELDRFVHKLRVYSIGDQDIKLTPEGTGQWIRDHFPEIFYIEAGPQWVRSKHGGWAGYVGIYQNDTRGRFDSLMPLVRKGQEYNDTTWVKENILPFGALGEGYPPDVNIIPNTPRNSRGVKEGDTPSWFYVLPHGMNDPGHPEWGGWGGRFELIFGNFYADAQDDHWSGNSDSGLRRTWAIARWREAYQNDFAARMRWCVLSYDEANHHPEATIDGDRSEGILIRKLKTGKSISLNAGKSNDPDGDEIQYKWWIYHEASSSTGILHHANQSKVKLETSRFSPEGEIHIILEVTDTGTPKLRSYRRIIVKVEK